MTGKTDVFAISVTLLCLLITACCARRTDVDIPVCNLKDGDIVFRRGVGFTSQVVLRVDEKGVYSHLGIVKFVDGECCVVHAVPGEPDFEGDTDRVKLEPIDDFFLWSKASSGAVMRFDGDSVAAGRAADHAYRLYCRHVLFDHDYDKEDSTMMYCTELVDYAYKKEGIDLPEGRVSRISLPGFNGEYILPNDIACNRKLRVIYKY